MTESIIEMQTTLNNKRNDFMNWIEINVEDPKVLNAAIKYFDYEESVRKATIRIAEIDLASAKSIDLKNKNIENVILHHSMDTAFNEDKANRWLCKALELVLIDKHTFDGIKFDNGSVKYLKTRILK